MALAVAAIRINAIPTVRKATVPVERPFSRKWKVVVVLLPAVIGYVLAFPNRAPLHLISGTGTVVKDVPSQHAGALQSCKNFGPSRMPRELGRYIRVVRGI